MCRLTRCIIKVYALCGVYQTDNLMYDYPVGDKNNRNSVNKCVSNQYLTHPGVQRIKVLTFERK